MELTTLAVGEVRQQNGYQYQHNDIYLIVASKRE